MRLARPELKRCELALYDKIRGNLRVVAADRYAPGTPLAEVASSRLEQHDPQADHAKLLELAARCEQFSPVVGLEGTDNLLLDVTGLESLFGGERSLMGQVVEAFRQYGLTIRPAMADTVGAAWGLAHFGQPAIIARPGNFPLTELPLAALRLPGQMIKVLHELGIEQVGQLLALPRPSLASRFSEPLLLRLDQATGLVPEPIRSHRPLPDIAAEKLLEYPVGDRAAVNFLLQQLIGEVCRSLVERQQGAIRLECCLQMESGQQVKTLVGVFRPSARPQHLCELAQGQLDRLTLPGPVAAAAVSVLLSAPLESRQQDLFESSQAEGRRQVGLLIDRLSSRLGRNNVVEAVPQADAQPELAFRYQPLAGNVRRRTKIRWNHLPRPLRLEREPRPLSAIAVAPDGPPVQFEGHRVARVWGPERIQFGWWRGRYIQRDYYRVETTAGKRFWLFRRLQDRKWFLHGVFD